MKKTNWLPATAIVSTDIALIKYWGKKDPILRLPENGSISLKLKGLTTTTTVKFDPNLKNDVVVVDEKIQDPDSRTFKRVTKHLDRIRKIADFSIFAEVNSTNLFPKGTGLSSSGSGMAALTLAGCKAAGLNLSERKLSILARQASGTACRCVCGGFVEWKDGEKSEDSYSESIYPASHWDIRDVVAVISEGEKTISSTEGHALAGSSPLFEGRQKHINNKIKKIKKHIDNKDFIAFGELVEAEALEFHSILLTSTPPLIFWLPGTVAVMHEVRKLRSEGILCYFTLNTGFNIHVLTLPEYQNQVAKRIRATEGVKSILLASVDGKPEIKG